MSSNQLKQQEKRSAVRAWLPALGFILALCVGLIAYTFSPLILNWLDSRSGRFPPPGVSSQNLRIGATIFLFAITMLVAWTLVAIFIPKKKSKVTDNDLLKDRKSIYAEKAAKKKRQVKMRKAALDENRRKNKS
jgi:hypothetical protein